MTNALARNMPAEKFRMSYGSNRRNTLGTTQPFAALAAAVLAAAGLPTLHARGRLPIISVDARSCAGGQT